MEARTLLDRASRTRFKDNALEGIEALVYIASSIGHEITERKPDLVVLEDYSGGRGPNPFVLALTGEITGAAKLWMHSNGTPWKEVAAATLKKFVTGSGGGKKEQMWLGAFKRWGVDPSSLGGDDNNILDGYCLARMGLAMLFLDRGEYNATQNELAAFKAVRVGGSPRTKKKGRA